MSTANTEPRVKRLPRLVTKYDLITYFGVSYKILWSRILTDDLLEGWGFTYKALKSVRTLPPNLTARIYEHFGIDDLDAGNDQQVRGDTPEPTGNRAPTEDI